MSDEFRKAAEAAAAARGGNTSAGSNEDSLTGHQPQTGTDSLMGGGRLPSLFTKEHKLNEKRSGVIIEEPREKHSTDFAGKLRYWNKQNQPTTDETDRPIMDTVFVLQTDYRFTPEELQEREMDDDDGLRGLFAGGEDLKAIRAAINKAGLRGKPRSVLVGKTLTIWRSGQLDVGKGNKKWLYTAEITG